MDRDRPIGIFDSGVGGLTVFAAIRLFLPNESLFYLGDTARVPYGTKSSETVIRYSVQNIEFLMGKEVKAIVVACNTASAYAMEELQRRFDIPVIGVVEPGAAAAHVVSQNHRIGVIGTPATIQSKAYERALNALDQKTRVSSKACPLFVSLVEEGWHDDHIVRLIAERYLAPLQNDNIDTLVLGCTHYPLLKRMIQEVMGEEVKIVDSAEATAAALKKLLEKHHLLSERLRENHCLFVTDLPHHFEEVALRFLGYGLPPVEHVSFG